MKAVIQAGGKGTRIAGITQNVIPKPMLPIGDFPILEHQINCLKNAGIDEVIIVTGFLGEVIKDYFSKKDLGIKVSFFHEDPEKPLGTAGALYYFKEKINDDFILLFGDVFFNVNFTKMINFHQENKSDATLLTHPNSHPFDSDLVICDEAGKISAFDSKNNIRNYDYNNLVNSGIYLFSKKIFDYIKEPIKMGLEHDVIAKMLENGENVFSYTSTEYVKDMGTPERFNSVNQDYANGICDARNLANKQKCIFLDRDGTINEYVGFLRNKEQMRLIPGVSQAIKKINSSEYLCIVITNQPVLARGEVTKEGLDDIHKRMYTLLGKEGAYVDGLYYCPHHPDKGYEGEIAELKIDCDCRKPKTGLVDQAVEKYNIDLANSIMIGDSTLDIKMAENAGMRSILLNTGQRGMDGKYDIHPDEVCEDLNEAIDKILYKKERKR